MCKPQLKFDCTSLEAHTQGSISRVQLDRTLDLILTIMAALPTLFIAVFMVQVVTGNYSLQNGSQRVNNAAEFAINFHNQMSNYPYAYKVIAVLSAKVEVYPPTREKYTMAVQVGQTVCKNEARQNLRDCGLQNNTKKMTCEFIVLMGPGFNITPNYLLSDSCV